MYMRARVCCVVFFTAVRFNIDVEKNKLSVSKQRLKQLECDFFTDR